VTRSFSIAPASPTGRIDGHNLRPSTGGRAEFHVDGTVPGAPSGQLVYDAGGSGLRFAANTITSLTIAPDGRSATFTGADANGTTFVAYVEDNGTQQGPHDQDVFKLWIGGVLQTGDGSLDFGQIEISLDP
jgi:hypothetical protein